MDIHLLEHIPFDFDRADLMKRLRVRPKDEADFAAIVDQALEIANLRAIYTVAKIEEHCVDGVVIAGRKFTSRILSVNLAKTEQVYPFVCSCGMELEEWSRKIDDVLWEFWAEGIKEEALRAAMMALQEHLHMSYNPGHISTMSPGSLEDWPISQQMELFDLLGHPASVQLTDSMLMVPTKSVSGITFAIEANFESCQLCTRDDCPGRRAPYDETLYERAYCQAPE